MAVLCKSTFCHFSLFGSLSKKIRKSNKILFPDIVMFFKRGQRNRLIDSCSNITAFDNFYKSEARIVVVCYHYY